MKIQSFTTHADGLTCLWGDTAATSQQVSWRWLRDHGEDEHSLDQQTRQRRVDTFAIDSTEAATAVSWDEANDRLQLTWRDEQLTYISGKTLRTLMGVSAPRLSPQHWHQENMVAAVQFEFADIMADDAAVLAWLDELQRMGFAKVANCPTSIDGTIAIAERIAPAQRTIFGEYWPLAAELTDHQDTAYSSEYLAPHTDGTYYHNAAGYQMFNCLEYDAKGGESVVVDGFALAELLAQQAPEYARVLEQIAVPCHYIEPNVELRAMRPVIQRNGDGSLRQISFNNYDRAPMLLDKAQMEAFYEAYSAFNALTLQQENWRCIPLRPGDTLIFDNWRCLHGRLGYRGKRVFHGCYHDKAEVESRHRVLAAALAA